MTIRLLPKIFAVVRAIRLGVPDADWVATTLNPKFEGYLDRAPKQNAKGVTQVAPFVRPPPGSGNWRENGKGQRRNIRGQNYRSAINKAPVTAKAAVQA